MAVTNKYTVLKHHNHPHKQTLPAHSRLRRNLPVMGNFNACVHSLSRHEYILDAKGKSVLISYALPCQKKHNAGMHQDALGRQWA